MRGALNGLITFICIAGICSTAVGGGNGLETPDLSATACLARTGDSLFVRWALKNRSPVSVDIPEQSLPWGSYPYGAVYQLTESSRSKPAVPSVALGSSMNIVTIAPGQQINGTASLTSVFPEVQSVLDAGGAVQWRYEARPLRTDHALTLAGTLRKSDVCSD